MCSFSCAGVSAARRHVHAVCVSSLFSTRALCACSACRPSSLLAMSRSGEAVLDLRSCRKCAGSPPSYMRKVGCLNIYCRAYYMSNPRGSDFNPWSRGAEPGKEWDPKTWAKSGMADKIESQLLEKELVKIKAELLSDDEDEEAGPSGLAESVGTVESSAPGIVLKEGPGGEATAPASLEEAEAGAAEDSQVIDEAAQADKVQDKDTEKDKEKEKDKEEKEKDKQKEKDKDQDKEKPPQEVPDQAAEPPSKKARKGEHILADYGSESEVERTAGDEDEPEILTDKTTLDKLTKRYKKKNKGVARKVWILARMQQLKNEGRWVGSAPSASDKDERLRREASK